MPYYFVCFHRKPSQYPENAMTSGELSGGQLELNTIESIIKLYFIHMTVLIFNNNDSMTIHGYVTILGPV